MPMYDAEGTILSAVYDAEGTRLAYAYDAEGTVIYSDEVREWIATAVVTELPNINVRGVKQGGCTDGTYIYQCSGDSTNHSYMDVIKYKISDGTYEKVTFEGTPDFGHANDMRYNPNTGYLYICTMMSDGSIIVLDADDLSYVDTIYITNDEGNSFAPWQICYDRNENKYYTTYNNKILRYDNQWNYIGSVPLTPTPTATQQGCETDGLYYYRITYDPNLINVCTLTGDLVTNITNPVTGEPEAIMYDWNGHYYFSGYTTPSKFNAIQLYTTES